MQRVRERLEPVDQARAGAREVGGGVDIGAIEFIHNQIIKMRDAGKAILLVSVELDEIRSLSDRILVMFDGRIVGEADPATATEGELGLMMAGIAGKPSTAAEAVP